MVQVRITEITGGTFPVQAFISDIYGNNQFLLGTISGVPPTVYYNTTIPAIFQTAPEIMLRLVDANGCESVKILDCTFGCTFNITVELESCIVNIDIQNAICGFNIICT